MNAHAVAPFDARPSLSEKYAEFRRNNYSRLAVQNGGERQTKKGAAISPPHAMGDCNRISALNFLCRTRRRFYE
jgi:hypothetical protein